MSDSRTGGRDDSAASPPGLRIASLDVLRGVVMVLMVLDHARIFLSNADFEPTDLSRSTSAYFLTRWVTHFCAPWFVFLAGVGAFLFGARHGRAALTRFLLSRGVWLIVIELTVVRFGWTFNFDYAHYMLAGVIWAIGWCMILLAGLIWLPLAGVAAFGLAVVLGHNILDAYLPGWMAGIRAGPVAWLWQTLYIGGAIRIAGGPPLLVLYSLFPWIGVMACGYALGPVMTWRPATRTRFCLLAGGVAVAAFLVLRGWNLYGEVRPWSAQSSPLFTLWSFLNTRKYPASLPFLLMTLGPILLAIPLIERLAARADWRGRMLSPLRMFGRTPFLFYVLHLPVIHLIAVASSWFQLGRLDPWLWQNHPLMAGPSPEGFGLGLVGVYAVALAVVLLLYWPCRAMSGWKDRSRSGWPSFL
jgi:uncharacterized membrane protein